MSSEHTNAVAGPSNLYASFAPATPAPHSALFLPPPAPPLPKQHLASTQDLLGRFHLHPAYDKYVRPFVLPGNDHPPDGVPPATPDAMPPTPGAVDKGKGREMDAGMGSMGPAGGGDADADDEDGPGGKGEKKKKNTYKHLIKGVPGKHSLKKDDYLTTMMLVPPKQRMQISPFDLRTQKDAFSVTLEGLKGWNINALVLESAQAREDRKKRKELKRLAKQQQALGAPTPSSAPTPIALAHPQPIPAPAQQQQSDTVAISRPATTGGVGGGAPPQPQRGVGTPRPGSTVPRPGSAVPRPGSASVATSAVPQPGSTVPRPGSTIPRPEATIPRPGSAAPTLTQQQKPVLPHVQVPAGRVGTPMRTGTPTSATLLDSGGRGKKRERDELPGAGGYTNGIGNVNGAGGYGTVNGGVNGAGNGNGNGGVATMGIVNAKAGVTGVRPRPIKKQRVDVQGQARDVSTPVQQPTPQGV